MPVPSEEFEPNTSVAFLGHGGLAFGAPMHAPSAGLQFNYAYAPPRQDAYAPQDPYASQDPYAPPRQDPFAFGDHDTFAMPHRYSPPLNNQMGMGYPMNGTNNGNMLSLRDQFLSPATVPKPSLGIGMHLGLNTASEMFDRFDSDRNGSLPVEELMPCAEALWKALHYGAGDMPINTRDTLRNAMEEKIVAPGASFVEFGEFVAWYEECVERITPPPAPPVGSPPFRPMAQPRSDPLPSWGGAESMHGYATGSWGPSAGDGAYGKSYHDGPAFPSSSVAWGEGDVQQSSSLHNWRSVAQALPSEQPDQRDLANGQQSYYSEQQAHSQHQPIRQYYQDPTTGQLFAASDPPSQYSTGEGARGQPESYPAGEGPMSGQPAQVTASQMQQGQLVLIPNPHDPNGPPQLVLQIPASAPPEPPFQSSPVLTAQGDPGVPPLTPTQNAPASPASPPSIDTTPQPVPHGIPPAASPPSPALPLSMHSPTSVSLPPAAPPPQPAFPSQPVAPSALGRSDAVPDTLPAAPPQEAALVQPAAAAAEETFLCDFHCGFSGSFEAVSMHEGNCAYNPANGGAGAGLAQPQPPAGMAQPAYSKRMRLSQQVTPMTPVMEGGEDAELEVSHDLE